MKTAKKKTGTKSRKKRTGLVAFDDPQTIIDAIRRNNGILAWAARELDVSLMTIWNYRQKWPEVDKAWKECAPINAAWIKGKLYDRADQGSDKALIFLASRKCPDLRPPPQERIHRHGQDPNAPPIQHRHLTLDVSTLPLELKRALLEHIRSTSKADEAQTIPMEKKA